MVKLTTCQTVFSGHCQHWGLTDTEHALVHAVSRRINQVAELDTAAGITIGSGNSSTSVSEDGPALEALLADEGYRVVSKES